MLEISSLSVTLNKFQVLKNINLSIRRKEVLGIIGVNGSGKTSMLNAIYGYLDFEGDVFFDGKNLEKNQIYFSESNPFYYEHIKVSDLIKLFAEPKEVVDLLEYFNVEKYKFISELSFGTKRKLDLCLNLQSNREVYLFDEPFNGLDFRSKHKLMKSIRRLIDLDKIIIIASHDHLNLISICDKIIVLDEGEKKVEFNKNSFDKLEKELI